MNALPNDTIAAIATGPGEAGISVIRVAGRDSLRIADAVFRCKGDVPSRRPGGTFVYGKVAAAPAPAARETSGILDEAILLIYRAPHSYTREDAVEIQCHGGMIAARRVLRRVLDAGARLADPGEFTKRAFLNGRMDLLQAEAVLDLIRARSDYAAQVAVDQLGGALTNLLNSVYDDIMSIVADLEASLDFTEDEIPDKLMPAITARFSQTRDRVADILSQWDEGRVLREGILIVIAGKPNSGKSSLFNRLLGVSRAIVTPVAGTTRDTIEESLTVAGAQVRLVDTAGLRATACDVEREGIRRAIEQIDASDVCIYVVDSQIVLDSYNLEMLKEMDPSRSIVVFNKIDLSCQVLPRDLPGRTIVRTCMLTGEGVPDLREAIDAKVRSFAMRDGILPVSERHRQVLIELAEALGEAIATLSGGREDLVVPTITSVRQAVNGIATLTGRIYQDDLLNQIFSRFCVGK